MSAPNLSFESRPFAGYLAVGCRYPACPLSAHRDHDRHRDRDGSVLCDILTGVPRQNFIDKGLIADAPSACFLAELIEHSRVDPDRDQPARLVAKRRTTDTPHGLQLLGG